jgi:hypothetical protein
MVSAPLFSQDASVMLEPIHERFSRIASLRADFSMEARLLSYIPQVGEIIWRELAA